MLCAAEMPDVDPMTELLERSWFPLLRAVKIQQVECEARLQALRRIHKDWQEAYERLANLETIQHAIEAQMIAVAGEAPDPADLEIQYGSDNSCTQRQWAAGSQT